MVGDIGIGMKLRLFVLVVVEGEESSWEVVTCEDAVSPRERPETHFRVREEVFRKTLGMQLTGTKKKPVPFLLHLLAPWLGLVLNGVQCGDHVVELLPYQFIG